MKKMLKTLFFLFILTLQITNVVANEYYQPLDNGDKALLKEMFKPAFKLLGMIPYFATVAAVIYIVYAGFSLITAGYNNEKKERIKAMIAGTIIGLVIVWAAPAFVDYLLS